MNCNTEGAIFKSAEDRSHGDYYRLFTVGLVLFSIYLVVKGYLDGPEINVPDAANEDGVHNEVDGDHRANDNNHVLELHRMAVDHVINDHVINDDHVIDDQQQQTTNVAADDDVIRTAADRRRRRRIVDVFTVQLWPETDYFADEDEDEEDESEDGVLGAGLVAARSARRRPERGNRSRKSVQRLLFARNPAAAAAREAAATSGGEEERAAASSEDRFEDTEDGYTGGGGGRGGGGGGGYSGSVATETDDEFSGRGIQGTEFAASSREPRTDLVTCSSSAKEPTDEETIDQTCAVSNSPSEEDVDACRVQTADDDDSASVVARGNSNHGNDSTSVARGNSNHGNAPTASVDDDWRNKGGSNCIGGGGKFGGKRTETSSPAPPPPSTHPIIDHLNAKLLEQLTADIVRRLESQKVSENRLREELEAMVKARRDSERCYSDVVEQMRRFGLAWEVARPMEAIRDQERRKKNEEDEEATEEEEEEQTPRT